MQFLNPTLFGALLAAAFAPLLIHLLNKKFPLKILFSSIDDIRRTMAQRSKLFKWRHIILTILRTLAILLLIFAFLRPVVAKFSQAPTGAESRYALIVIDHSLSMEHKSGLSTARGRAVSEARKIIDTLAPDDQVNVVLAGRQPSACFFDFSANHRGAAEFVENIGPGLGTADLARANDLAGRLLGNANGRREVFYISDYQRKNWASTDFSQLPSGTRVFFIEATPKRQRENRGILDATLDDPVILAGQPIKVEVAVGNFTSEPFESVVEAILDGKSSLQFPVAAAPWSIGKTTLSLNAPSPGVHGLELRLPEDDLSHDDRRHLALQVLEKEEVVILTDAPPGPGSAERFIGTALNPFQDNAGSLLPRRLNSADLSTTSLAGGSKIVATAVARLDESKAQVLASFLERGGGLIYFLDGEDDRHNLENLDQALQGEGLPLKLMARQKAENFGTGAQQISRGEFKSPFLRLFRGERRQNLALLEFYECYHAVPTGKGTILLSYADDTPALAQTFTGLGTVLLCNFSVTESSSNLARRRLFPAWIQEMVKHIGADEASIESHLVDDEVHAELWQADLAGKEILAPDGTPAKTRREPNGERTRIAFTASQPGLYRLPGTGALPLSAWAVNVSGDESDLRAIDSAMLPSRAGENKQTEAHFLGGQPSYSELINGKPVYHYFVLAALAFLLLETLFQPLAMIGRGRRSSNPQP